MRNIYRLSVVFVLIVALAALASAQSTAKPNPAYDAELAKKLGGNDGGMKNYVLVILKTGPSDASVKGDERKKAFEGHFANINKLADEGKLAVAGPFGKNDKAFRGLFIMNTSAVEEAQKWTEADPTVKSGIFVVDYIPWFGSASLMATNEIHKKIAKTIE
jgi:uncharacterized protein